MTSQEHPGYMFLCQVVSQEHPGPTLAQTGLTFCHGATAIRNQLTESQQETETKKGHYQKRLQHHEAISMISSKTQTQAAVCDPISWA